MRPGALALTTALAVVISGCAGATSSLSSRHPPGSSADPAAHAKAEADRLLGLVRMPSTAKAVDHAPATALAQPSQTTATADIIDEHRWWTVSSDAETTLAWLQKNGMTHLKSSGTGTSGGPEGVTEYTLIFDARPPSGIDSEEVQLDVAPMGNGTAGIRADAQVVWLVNRSPDETIPRTTDRLEVSASNRGEQIGHRILTGGKARRLVDIINALPTAVRAEHSCAADTGYALRVVATRLVFDEDVACRDIAVTDDGRSLPALEGTQRFIDTVTSSMGLPDNMSR